MNHVSPVSSHVMARQQKFSPILSLRSRTSIFPRFRYYKVKLLLSSITLLENRTAIIPDSVTGKQNFYFPSFCHWKAELPFSFILLLEIKTAIFPDFLTGEQNFHFPYQGKRFQEGRRHSSGNDIKAILWERLLIKSRQTHEMFKERNDKNDGFHVKIWPYINDYK